MNAVRRELFSKVNRIVIKLGSRLLVDLEGNGVNRRTITRMVGSIAKLRQEGKEVVLVTSGAVGNGMALLGLSKKPDHVSDKQACAAIGQTQLMMAYQKVAQRHGFHVGQILCSADDFRDRTRYKNIKETVEALLRLGAVPVINENDSVAITEIKVGDNDKLSADVSQFLGADLLIIFTDEEGLFDKNPKEHSDATLIRLVHQIDQSIERLAGGLGSAISTGGMATKIAAAKQATEVGCAVVLASGFKVLPHWVVAGRNYGTLFMPAEKKSGSRHRWIRLISNPKGKVVVDSGAVAALVKKGRSLLPVGIVKVEGRFAAGEIIEVRSSDGRAIARGIASWDSETVKRLQGLKSAEVKPLLGAGRPEEVIHRNNLALL